MSKIFKNQYWTILWTVLRVWIGWEWLEAGWGKVTGAGSTKWIGEQAGTAIKGFFGNAIKNSVVTPTNQHPSVEGWYGWVTQNIFLPSAPILTYVVPFLEVAIGLALILGALTTIALYSAALMNLMFMLSGSAGVNPRMYTIAIILLVVGASAYSIGLDRWVIPFVKEKLGMKNTPPAT